MKWMLFSDLFPIFLFSLFIGSGRPLVFALIASRLSSCVYHLYKETRPHLINLDYLGLSCMVIASLEVCEKVHCAYRIQYTYLVLGTFAASTCIFIRGLWVKRSSSRYIVLMVALLGHYPSAYAILTFHEQSHWLMLSATAFVLGYFVIEPRNHTGWHWTASLGQGVLLVIN
jgi:predicted membrane channel-forming protein YqfA (hemolysin III family)